jgi:hypothetical protein
MVSISPVADAEKLRSVLDRRQRQLQAAPAQLFEELAHARERPQARQVRFAGDRSHRDVTILLAGSELRLYIV